MRWYHVACFAGLLGFALAPAEAKDDGSPHTEKRVDVGDGVSLEVLDWGGNGPAIILMGGLGDTAHHFDDLGPKLRDVAHVYAITRRGFGESSKPKPPAFDVKATSYSLIAERRDPKEPNAYDADRLGDDVVAVIDALKLDRPILIGESTGGEEVSSVAARYPKKIAGAVYLDALGEYAYFPGPENKMMFKGTHPWAIGNDRPSDIILAILFGRKKFAAPGVPALAIVGYPNLPPARARDDTDERNAFYKAEAENAARFDSFARIKGAHMVRLANSGRDLMRKDEAEVLKRVRAFIAEVK